MKSGIDRSEAITAPAVGAREPLLARLGRESLRLAVRWRANEFVREIYLGVLEREPDPEGAAAYGAELKRHGDIAGILRDFVHSGELRRKISVMLFPDLVTGAYRGLLGREPDLEGKHSHVAALVEGENISAFLSDMVNSGEFKAKQLARLAQDFSSAIYGKILRREATPHEAAAIAGALTEPGALAALVKQMVETEEFQQHLLATHIPRLISALYRGLLGREPDPAGHQAFTATVSENRDFDAIVLSMTESPEFKSRHFVQLAPGLLQSAYKGLLGRDAKSEEVAANFPRLIADRELGPTLARLIGMPEFHQRTFASHLPKFVDAACRGLFGEAPRLRSIHPRGIEDVAGFFSDISDSAEYKDLQIRRLTPDFVKVVYRAVLHRDAEAAELKAVDSQLQTDGSLVDILKQLLGTAEFQRSLFASHAPDLVKAAYRGLLKREPDSEGMRAYTSFLAGIQDLTAFFLDITESAEFKEKHLGESREETPDISPQDALLREDLLDSPITKALVCAAFNFILGRPPTAADVSAHIDYKTAGDLRMALIQSEEFRRRMTLLFPTKIPDAADIDAPKTIFLHLPKTGGTTLRDLLTPFFERKEICPELFNGLHCYKAGELAKYRLFFGHFTLQSCDLIPGPRRIFTMLRHPLDRLVSHYNFASAHTARLIGRDPLWKLAREHKLRDFFSLDRVRLDAGVNNSMVRSLARTLSFNPQDVRIQIEADFTAKDLVETAKKNLASMSGFGILERYGESVELIFHTLSLPAPLRIEPKNVFKEIVGKASGIEQVEPQVCDQEAMDIVAPLIEADLELYNYGLDLFEKRFKTLRHLQQEQSASL